jgi:hypothetical protein
MQKEQIFVFGQGSIAPAVLEHSRQHTLITAGMQKHNNIANFVCVNDTKQLDQLMGNRAKAMIFAPRNIYARYAFFKGVECLPHFEDLVDYNWDPHVVSDQLCSVALAAWMGANTIVMAGYEMQDRKERDNIRAMMTLYSNIEFISVSKDNAKLDDIKLANFAVMDQPQYKQRMRSNV